MKSRPFLISALIVTLACDLHAEEKQIKFETLLDYKNVTVTKIEPDGIRIMHESGATKISIEKVPEEIVAKLGMNYESANKHRKEIAIHNQKIELAAKKNQVLASAKVQVYGRIYQVAENGVLLKNARYTDGTKEEEKKPYQVRTGGATALHPDAKSTYRTAYESEWVIVEKLMPKLIFVECDSSGYVDNGWFKMSAYQAGTYAYQNVLGARNTIPRYTTDASSVLKRAGLSPG